MPSILDLDCDKCGRKITEEDFHFHPEHSADEEGTIKAEMRVICLACSRRLDALERLAKARRVAE